MSGPFVIRTWSAVGVLMVAASVLVADEQRDALWTAVRNGDVAGLKELLAKGTDVNAQNEIGITALWIAAGKNNAEVVDLLIAHGADVNARDGIWYQTPLSTAAGGDSEEIFQKILAAGARDVDDAAMGLASRGNLSRLQLVLDTGKVGQDALDAALFSTGDDKKEVSEALVQAGAKPLPAADPADREKWAGLVGSFESDNGGAMSVEIADVGLITKSASGNKMPFRPIGENEFAPIGVADASLRFELSGDKVTRVFRRRFTSETYFYPAKPVAEVTVEPATDPSRGGPAAVEPLNWPQFRGPHASGIADRQDLPTQWDVHTGDNVRWKTDIPGLGHSCPVVWGDRIFVTTAISGDPDPKIRTGNYGDVESVDDKTSHQWQVFCLDRKTGEILWTKTAHEGVPKIKRHLKGSQANCTPVTDGKHVVACFGPEGLYCYDFEGKLLWSRDLSAIDSSFAIDREYEWGFGSSPIIHDGLVIVQFDLSHDSFIAAYSLEDGSRVWATDRDEIPSWSSPTVWSNSQRTEIVTNAAQYARSYDPSTGKELWRLAKKSEVTIPTPVPMGDLIFVVSGNRPIQPIFAIRAGAKGDISLPEGEGSSDHVAWSRMRGGPYMPTPIVYDSHLYICSNAGVLTCYDTANGEQIYRERIGGESYTASPIASDGRLFFVSEQGEVRVVKAGPEFQLLAVNKLEDVCMAVPAVASGTLYIRSQHHLFAIGRTATAN